MKTAQRIGTWRRLVLLVAALGSPLGVVSGASIEGLRGEQPSCCVGPDVGGCCPESEDSDDGPSYVPSCCGVGELPQEPREVERVPLQSPRDSDDRIARELVRGLAAHASVPVADVFPAEPFAPPECLRGSGAHARALHWLTERDARLALALLSVLRL
jgi:hypothetical protein